MSKARKTEVRAEDFFKLVLAAKSQLSDYARHKIELLVDFAIRSKMTFSKEAVELMVELGIYPYQTSSVYATACLYNRSACEAFEANRRFLPMFFRRKRLYVGQTLVMDGIQYTVRGFSSKPHKVLGQKQNRIPTVALSYDQPCDDAPNQVTSVSVYVTQDELSAGGKKQQEQAEPYRWVARAIKVFRHEFFYSRWSVNHARVSFKKLEDFWRHLQSDRENILKLLTAVNFPITLHEADRLATEEELIARVGNFDTNLLPLIQAEIKRREDAQAAKNKRVLLAEFGGTHELSPEEAAVPAKVLE